jgi:hypothetical protein
MLVIAAAACSAAPPRPEPAPAGPAWAGVAPQDAPRLRERFGLELLGLRAVAAGYLLELRCRILDAARAAPLVEGRVPVRLVEKGAAGPPAAAPRPGRLVAEGRPEEGRLDVFLAPSGAAVGPGARVHLAFGDLEIAGLPVEE